MEKWLKWAIEIQSLAQAGLTYTDNVYDIERYERLREIAAEIIEEKSNISLEKVKDLFCNENGYQTPKIDTRAAIFKDDKILLTHENNGTWSLPGGWCDVLESVASNTIKEVKEETGLEIDFWDERLTTVAAERSLIEGDVSRKKRKKVIDMLAAVIILQGYLDSKSKF